MPIQGHEIVDFPLVKMKGERRIIPQYLEPVPVTTRGPLRDARIRRRKKKRTGRSRGVVPSGRLSPDEKAQNLLKEGLECVCPPLSREEALLAISSKSGVSVNALQAFLQSGIPLRVRDLVLMEGLAPVIEHFFREQRGVPPCWTGRYIEILRDRRDLSQCELASLLRREPSTIQRWENGGRIPYSCWESLDQLWLGW